MWSSYFNGNNKKLLDIKKYPVARRFLYKLNVAITGYVILRLREYFTTSYCKFLTLWQNETVVVMIVDNLRYVVYVVKGTTTHN